MYVQADGQGQQWEQKPYQSLKKKEVKKPNETNISQDTCLTEPTATQYPSSCPFQLSSLLIWGLTVIWSYQPAQGSPKGCTFPLLCAGLEEKAREKESWRHRATLFRCKSMGSKGRSRQSRAIPSCPLQPATPRAVWPWDREQTPCLVARCPPSPSYPPWRMESRNGRAGDAPSCQCPTAAVPPGVGNSPFPLRNSRGFWDQNLVQQQRHKWYK